MGLYLRSTMAKQKSKAASAAKAKVRVAPKKRAPAGKRAARNGARSKRAAGKQPPQKLFDAMKWVGVIPDMAEGYIESLREEARLNEEKADRLAQAMVQRSTGKGTRRTRKKDPGVIDVDRFFGAMPHLKGDAVKVQRQLRNEW
jgi:hypothetical protein